ncbi:hypothetical protein FQN49_002479, partial [Arthroderma sp. PD_2]
VAVLGFPSDEATYKAAHGLLLNVDPTAPTMLSKDQKNRIKNDSDVLRLRRKRSKLSRALRELGFKSIPSSQGKTPLYDEGRGVVAEAGRRSGPHEHLGAERGAVSATPT